VHARRLAGIHLASIGNIPDAIAVQNALVEAYPEAMGVRRDLLATLYCARDTARLQQVLGDVVERGVLPGSRERQDWIHPPPMRPSSRARPGCERRRTTSRRGGCIWISSPGARAAGRQWPRPGPGSSSSKRAVALLKTLLEALVARDHDGQRSGPVLSALAELGQSNLVLRYWKEHRDLCRRLTPVRACLGWVLANAGSARSAELHEWLSDWREHRDAPAWALANFCLSMLQPEGALHRDRLEELLAAARCGAVDSHPALLHRQRHAAVGAGGDVATAHAYRRRGAAAAARAEPAPASARSRLARTLTGHEAGRAAGGSFCRECAAVSEVAGAEPVIPSVRREREAAMTSQKRTASLSAVNWHAMAADEALRELRTSIAGLAGAEVERRRQEFGRNTLPESEPPTLLEIVLHQLRSPLIYVLMVAGVVSLAIGEVVDAAFIAVVIGLNAAIGTYQEFKAEAGAAALQRLLQIVARVRREGKELSVPAEELVPGDIVLLESGNKVPADLRLLQCSSLAIDESFLTGESVAAGKGSEPTAPDTPVADRGSMAFAGSTVTSGRGVGVVVATGPATQVGQIAETVTAAEGSKPPLVIRMERFAHQISFVVLGATALLGLVAVGQGMPYTDVFFLAVALAVSAIPEGLPVALTVALSIASGRMARRNVIVRKLTAVESLGSCQIIASDKTGTLTVNQQTVRTILLPDGRRFEVTGEGYRGEGEVRTMEGAAPDETARQALFGLAEAAVLCNEGTLTEDGGEWRHSGDAMDVALLALGHKLGLSPSDARQRSALLAEIPFESERRYAATFHARGAHTLVSVKGAVEKVLPLCTRALGRDGETELDPARVEEVALALAGEGYRVLAVASGRMAGQPRGGELEEKDLPPLTLLGLVGFIDPLRPEAKAAVEACRDAGVTVLMITGDHPATALAIARELGIAESPRDVITGAELQALAESDPQELSRALGRYRVFARVSPLQKFDIVQGLVDAGSFVAVTGDGVNDAPALKKANIGVAMGSGTDIAKDTAEMIVTDDNFASIVAGIEEGRFAYANVRKVTYLLISTGAAEVVLFTLSLLFGLPLPLLAVQLLWLNLVTNGIQDVALAFEGGESGAMKRPPRRPAEGIFDRRMIEQTVVSGLTMAAVAFGAWFWMNEQGWDEGTARNFLLLLVVAMQNVHVFNCRSESISAFRVPLRRNRILVAGVFAAQGLHILAMNLPFMQTVLRTAPISPLRWLLLAGLALPMLAVMELYKLIRRERLR